MTPTSKPSNMYLNETSTVRRFSFMCDKYLEKDLKKRYNRKRNQTLKNRNVGWELSFEDYKTLKSKQTNCDYTGLPFSDDNIQTVCLVFNNMLKNNLFTKKELLKAVDNF